MNTATDDHRYMITTPWGDYAYADTQAGAQAARQQLARDRRDDGYDVRDVTAVSIIDRGPAPAPEAVAA